jgi:hypothetical protein
VANCDSRSRILEVNHFDGGEENFKFI